MSMPRRILPGNVYFITRRCVLRKFMLHPDETTANIINYCLALAAKRCDINLIAWLAMSNHYHAVVHDPTGRLPEFLAYFHKLAAKALNRRWDRTENLWAVRPTCVTLLPTLNDIL